MVQVSVNGVCTPLVEVERGVLQGGPCSPVLFNLCFNTLMVTVADKKYQQLGYMWSTTNPRAWMQFADDAALIAHDVKGAQALLDLSAAWCSWANMKIRTDKCCTFGMTKRDGQYTQIQLALYIDGNTIPPIELGGSFTYLGKSFNFSMNNEAAKAQLIKSVSHMMDVTDTLQVRTQTKLKIL